MRILCAYANLRDRTREALDRYAGPVDYVDVSGDDYAYWAAIEERWTGEDDLLLVEHDIVIHADVISQLEACDKEWCTFPYLLWEPDGWIYNGLGCTRYSASLQKRVGAGEIRGASALWLVPVVADDRTIEYEAIRALEEGSACRCGEKGHAPCWKHIDSKIADTLEGRGPRGEIVGSAHVHFPPVFHLPVQDHSDPAYRSCHTAYEAPSRTYQSASLDDRPPWWPARPRGVQVTER